jgi:hypothetical protein
MCLLAACDQLGNPPQFATGPTQWYDSEHGRLVTTTRSFRNENTIRNLVSEGLEGFDYADPAIGPKQTLTVVSVTHVPVRETRVRRLQLVTIFKLGDQPPIVRRWSASTRSRRWNAAFAMPEPPSGAVTSVGP